MQGVVIDLDYIYPGQQIKPYGLFKNNSLIPKAVCVHQAVVPRSHSRGRSQLSQVNCLSSIACTNKEDDLVCFETYPFNWVGLDRWQRSMDEAASGQGLTRASFGTNCPTPTSSVNYDCLMGSRTM